jgi:hypothetical protein
VSPTGDTLRVVEQFAPGLLAERRLVSSLGKARRLHGGILIFDGIVAQRVIVFVVRSGGPEVPIPSLDRA